ncbi:MAG: ABC transporter ATP-binding protein [Anaerolineae bacterium]|nr:ABC transporter ATP-binding protein [Anaerolineae bacterium]
MALIEIRGLRRYYVMGDTVVRALDGVNLTIEQGEFLCLMGPSGSGKSTLLNMLGGLDKPTDGSIVVAGHRLSELDENGLALYRQHEVGFVFQSYNLIPTFTAAQNVEFPLVFTGVSPEERRHRAGNLLTELGLGDRLHHHPTEMSGGQQQRVAVARSLINQPHILLGDEPTGNLDSKTGAEILNLFVRLNRTGQTLIIVTHDPRVAEYGTRTIHMLDGRIVEDVENAQTNPDPELSPTEESLS